MAVGETTNHRQELVSESYRRRNWKGIALAILVICATVAIIVVTILFTSNSTDGEKLVFGGSNLSSEGTLDFNDVVSGYYSPSSFNGTFVSEKYIGFLDESGNYVLYHLDNKTQAILVSKDIIGNASVYMYKLSPTREYVILAFNHTKIYRHTFNATYKVYNVATGELKDINSDVADKFLQYVTWGPNGDQVVYVYGNNIYYMKSLKDSPKNVTSDGVADVIFNGIPDWVYEEEVLAADNAIWWSPNGSRLCFAKLNDSQVDIIDFMWYGPYDIENLYPKVRSIRYPKAGRPNPTVTLYIVDLANPDKKVEVTPPDDIKGEYYFTTLTWLDDERLLVIWMPRQQSTASISICSASNNWKCIENKLVTSDGWVSFYDSIRSTNDAYLLKLPKDKNYKHLAKISLNDSTQTFLTQGNFEVTEITAVADGRVYYVRTSEDKPNVRHFASVDLAGNSTETCHTCEYGENCTFNAVTMGPDGNYYAWVCLGPGVPFVTIVSLPNHLPVLTWTANEKLKTRLSGQVLPTIKTMRVPVAGGYDAIVKLYLPDDFNEKHRYPILVEVYGGPETQINSDAFKIGWGSYVSTVKKYIYATIDGRGSAFRGEKFLFQIYRHLGTVEIEDQIAVVKYLGQHTTYVDPTRAGIWGWSYGGFASSMALATGNDTFKCAASVAPVTSWYYYDSEYTERFMLRPQDNRASYNYSAVLSKAKNFKGKKFLLIHGTADDNVHVQQSMMLIQALSEEGILFNTHFYPDQDHSIRKYTKNLYYTLQQFFDECFRK